MKRTRSLLSASFFLCGTASFATLLWVNEILSTRFLREEPFYRSPVKVYSHRVMIRSDAFGKGYFGASRGVRGQRTHKGIDLLSPVSSPITAAKSGRVRIAGIDKGYGWYAEVAHSDGRLTRYAHLSRLFVTGGDWIAAGQKVGICGKSGNADDPRIRPHLHFEILEGGRAVDPRPLFDPKLSVK